MKAKKPKIPVKSSSRQKVAIKDLKVKNAGSVKGGVLTNRGVSIKIDDVK